MKKIQFKGYEDLKRCADEPIHLLGNVQAFGCLIVLDKQLLTPIFCSENVHEFFEYSVAEILSFSGEKISTFFNGAVSLDHWRALCAHPEDCLTRTITLQEEPHQLEVSVKDDFLFLAIEKITEVEQPGVDVINQSLSFIEIVNQYDDFKSYCQAITEKIRALLGYDRVMVYKFDEDFNGEVFAESLKEGLEPFLGLNYPHTDIPPQARELYKKSPIRILVDVNQKPVALCTLNETLTHASIDLGDSILRSVSPIHIEYLKNMGVTATMSLSIMIGQRLWGLVACHHHEPRYISPFRRQSAQLQVQFMASHIHHWERSENYGEVQEKEHIYQSIIEEAYKSKDIFQSIASTSYFIGLTGSTGGAVLKNGKLFTYGTVPTAEQIVGIQSWMKSNYERVFQSAQFSTYYAHAADFTSSASGILYYSLDDESNSAIMWFRAQLSEGKKWGGDRNEAIAKSTSLTPRASFEAWEELVEGKSEVWKAHEIQAGLRLGAYVEREIYIKNITFQKERYEKLNAELQQANEELNQFNWISSHDMKEPLRKIRLFIDQIKEQSESLNEQQSMYFVRIDAAAKRMQVLIDDLLNYAGLSKDASFEHHSLNKLVGEIADCYMGDNPGTEIQLGELRSIMCIDFQIKQLFSNLIGNSIKFRKEGQHAHIEIALTTLSKEDEERIKPAFPKDFIKIRYSDDGIGFGKEYNAQIFQVFQRLHSQWEYPGTGIGLAICKKIVDTHQGFLYAEGFPGEGAEFSIVLPREAMSIM